MYRKLLSVAVLSAFLIGQPGAPIAAQGPASRPASQAQPALVVVNINTATAKDLEMLPGVGTQTAARIIEYREKNGPFKKVEELMNVAGIGEKTFLRLKPQLTIAAKPER
jgi:competence protein ComEA